MKKWHIKKIIITRAPSLRMNIFYFLKIIKIDSIKSLESLEKKRFVLYI